MTALADALRNKFKTPQAALAALGLDSALLGGNTEENMGRISTTAALAIAKKIKGKFALDAAPEEVAKFLEEVEGLDALSPNGGIPAFASEHPEDRDEEFEDERDHRDDDAADRRSMDARRLLGRDETDEEAQRREEEVDFKPDDAREPGADRRAMRAADARRRLGRDESDEERMKREQEEMLQDRMRARDRVRTAMDYRRARDSHRRALDSWRKHAMDYKSADEECHTAMDSGDAAKAKAAEDRRNRHADDAKRARDSVMKARDARMKARDARRRARDKEPNFEGAPQTGGEMVSKTAMDAAIQSALRDNELRHQAISSAIETVRPKVGRIALDAAIQNEGDVYKRALSILGVPHDGITQIQALRQLYTMAPTPGSSNRAPSGFAMDSAPAANAQEKFKSLFPGADRIQSM